MLQAEVTTSEIIWDYSDTFKDQELNDITTKRNHIHYEIIDENSGKLTLLIISTECLENWQRIAKNAAVNAISMAPDYLAVPFAVSYTHLTLPTNREV